MTRDQLIVQIIRDQEARTKLPEGANDHRAEERRSDLAEVKEILESRLSEFEYLTCADFDLLDLNCCNNCHLGYPHYDMWEITLADGRHAWVCDPFRNVLMREIRGNTTPEQDEMIALLGEIFSQSPDPFVESLNTAILAAESDEERLRLSLTYVHHVYGRRRDDIEVEVIVTRARDLLGNAPARRAKIGEALPHHKLIRTRRLTRPGEPV